MNRDELDQLRDRLLAGELPEEERRRLYEAALRDQGLFDDLAAQEELVQTLGDGRAWSGIPVHQSAREDIARSRRGRSFPTRPFVTALALAATAVIAAGIVILSRRSPEPASTTPAKPALSPTEPSTSTSTALPPATEASAPLASGGYAPVGTLSVQDVSRRDGAPSRATSSRGSGAATAPNGGKSRGPAEDASSPGSLGDTYFSFGSDIIPLATLDAVDEAARHLKRFPSTRVLIEAHAGSTEAASPEETLALAEARAKHLKDYLIAKGADGSQIETRAVVTRTPPEPPADAGRSASRRASLLVIQP